MACLDTSFLIDLAGGRYGKRAWQKLAAIAHTEQALVTTRFNIAELYVGLARSDNPAAEGKAVQKLLANFGILEFDDRAALLFAQITAYLHAIGKPAGDMDVLIAATAMANGHSLITRDKKHFANVPRLNVVDY